MDLRSTPQGPVTTLIPQLVPRDDEAAAPEQPLHPPLDPQTRSLHRIRAVLDEIFRAAALLQGDPSRCAEVQIRQISADLNSALAVASRVNAAALGQSTANRRFERVLEFIDQHLGEPLSSHRLARLLSVTPNHLCRLFKDNLALSPHRYVIRRRLDRARILMKRTQYRLAHIAAECGFADAAHFSRLFRQNEGVAPRIWRGLHQSTE